MLANQTACFNVWRRFPRLGKSSHQVGDAVTHLPDSLRSRLDDVEAGTIPRRSFGLWHVTRRAARKVADGESLGKAVIRWLR